jgi:hypothetical protein
VRVAGWSARTRHDTTWQEPSFMARVVVFLEVAAGHSLARSQKFQTVKISRSLTYRLLWPNVLGSKGSTQFALFLGQVG